jgi:hypothetical protein
MKSKEAAGLRIFTVQSLTPIKSTKEWKTFNTWSKPYLLKTREQIAVGRN